MKTYLIIGSLFLAAALASGCAASRYLALQGTSVDERVQKYHDLFRWREYESASRYLLPSVRNDFLAVTNSYRQDLNVEDYAIKRITLDEEAREAKVVVSRSFFKMPSATLQREEIVQRWIRVAGDWYLSGPPY